MNNPAIEPVAKKYAELRYQLLPYTYTLAWEARDSGMPLMRAMWLHYPDDMRARGLGTQFMWGRDLLVAPVFTKGATSREVYLPSGDWYDWWTNAKSTGGQNVTRQVDLATMPIYVRAGAIIPFDAVRQYTSQPVSEPTTLRIYGGADGEYTLYDDDGISQDYLKARGTWTRIAWNDRAKQLTIEPGAPKGATNVIRQTRVQSAVASGRHDERSELRRQAHPGDVLKLGASRTARWQLASIRCGADFREQFLQAEFLRHVILDSRAAATKLLRVQFGHTNTELLLHLRQSLGIAADDEVSLPDRRVPCFLPDTRAIRFRQSLQRALAHEESHRQHQMVGEREMWRSLIEPIREDRHRLVLRAVDHARLQRRIHLGVRHRRRNGAEDLPRPGIRLAGHDADLQTRQIRRASDRPSGVEQQTVSGSKRRDQADFGTVGGMMRREGYQPLRRIPRRNAARLRTEMARRTGRRPYRTGWRD